MSYYAEDDLSLCDKNDLEEHIGRVKAVFEKTVMSTVGVKTYYYRIDPEASSTSKGFWFVNLSEEGFVEHEVTDISLYDTSDQTHLSWFTVPKTTGRSVWLSPYLTENLDVLVFFYNVPIFKDDEFIGVIGIEIDYNTIVAFVDNISLFENGYAFINDDEGNLLYHPRFSVAELTGDQTIPAPDGLVSDDKYLSYSRNSKASGVAAFT